MCLLPYQPEKTNAKLCPHVEKEQPLEVIMQ